MIVAADSSPLITLAKIGELDLLRLLFEKVYITPEVYDEVAVRGAGLPGAAEIANLSWIDVRAVSRRSDRDKGIRGNLGLGERSVILLSKEIGASLVLMDDKQARKLATEEGLAVLGCVGILSVAFRRGLIVDLTAIYRKLLASCAFIHPKILEAILAKLNQPPL